MEISRRAIVLVDAAVYYSGLSLDEYYLNEKAFEKFWEYGVKTLELIFHDEAGCVNLPGIGCPPVSYGHIVALGAKINYPVDSEPNVERMFGNLGEGVRHLKRERDFGDNELFKRYLRYTDMLKNYFPGKRIGISGLGVEGPVTTAVLLRGQDFFTDIYDNPYESKIFLELITNSVIDYRRFINKINGETEQPNVSTGLADDFAALINPGMFDEFVVPYWMRYYEQLAGDSGKRHLHCEGLDKNHLKYIEKAGIHFFDPTVSPKLTCKMLTEELKIPFDWVLPPFELFAKNIGEIEQWVYDTVIYKPNCIITEFDRNLARTNGIEKIRCFLNAFRL